MLHGLLKDLAQLENHNELQGPVMVIIGDAVAGASLEGARPFAQQLISTPELHILQAGEKEKA
jgi:uroporphyrin-III C-methyltransferase/precorrin-2 dehydrogenase/sirohydrochlorin ferrochelatase